MWITLIHDSSVFNITAKFYSCPGIFFFNVRLSRIISWGGWRLQDETIIGTRVWVNRKLGCKQQHFRRYTMPGAAWFHKTITPGWWRVIWHIFKNKWDKIFQLQTNLTSFYPEPSICLNCSATNYPSSRERPQRVTKRCLLTEINCWSDSRIESSWRRKSQVIRNRWDTDVLFFVFRGAFCAVFTRTFCGSCFLKICACLLHNTWCN